MFVIALLVVFLAFVVIMAAGHLESFLLAVVGIFLLFISSAIISTATEWEVMGKFYPAQRILEQGRVYEVISTGKLSDSDFWIIVKDNEGNPLAVRYDKEILAGKMVVAGQDGQTFSLIPCESIPVAESATNASVDTSPAPVGAHK